MLAMAASYREQKKNIADLERLSIVRLWMCTTRAATYARGGKALSLGGGIRAREINLTLDDLDRAQRDELGRRYVERPNGGCVD
ncbi:hypothetical protein [Bosea vaviloviae]|uniref:Uncharacterized protein n=1 Tax=Bosea vaviloviae TaxID=1526658 RepID=A0A1D7U4U4_9HYPH|nr:hypothetical protein [Bosea vaviloviae]AOO82393.1 hypothetical protein BHK69_19850 [Bosea vaviloviae]